ncbi:hypothetical protein FZC66_15440 [Priestia megaterium]|nr:hypothetical protein FZC66_15440 [Priestia megaterium]
MPDFFDEFEKIFEQHLMGSHEEQMKKIDSSMGNTERHDRQLQKQADELDRLYTDDPFGQ